MHARMLIPLLALACAAQAGAAEAIPQGARLAANCAACHGTNGATSGGALPPLAGQPKEALLASLRAYKTGARTSTIMTQIAKGYTDEQLAQLAAFFAAQPPSAALPLSLAPPSSPRRRGPRFDVAGGSPCIPAFAGMTAAAVNADTVPPMASFAQSVGSQP